MSEIVSIDDLREALNLLYMDTYGALGSDAALAALTQALDELERLRPQFNETTKQPPAAL